MPSEDEVFPAEEQPLPAAISPIADSPGYIADSDIEEDHEEDPIDYPVDGGNDDDDDDESSDDDKDDDDVEEDEDEKEEEEDHLAPADSVPPLIPSPQLPLSPPLPISPSLLPASPTHPLGYRAAMIRLRAETLSTFHPLLSSTPPSGTPPLLPIPLPTSSPPLLLPSTICKVGVSKVTLPPRKRFCIALGPRFKIEESSSPLTARPT
ncbi:hypothetical protein Tco_0914568, partial [Tanacetum coccineum]